MMPLPTPGFNLPQPSSFLNPTLPQAGLSLPTPDSFLRPAAPPAPPEAFAPVPIQEAMESVRLAGPLQKGDASTNDLYVAATRLLGQPDPAKQNTGNFLLELSRQLAAGNRELDADNNGLLGLWELSRLAGKKVPGTVSATDIAPRRAITYWA